MTQNHYNFVDIHPEGVSDIFYSLLDRDIQSLILDIKSFEHHSCPACHSDDVSPAFNYQSLDYSRCNHCQTLYINPCPSESRHLQFILESRAMEYWRSSLPPAMKLSRRPMYSERADFFLDALQSLSINPSTIVELGAGNGEFVQEILDRSSSLRILLLEPQALNVNSPRVEVIQDGFHSLSKLSVSTDAVVAWELLEHIVEPDNFLQLVSSMLKPGAPFIFSTPNEQSLETRLLSTCSSNILFDHVRLYNPRSIRILLDRNGFDVYSLTTPGRLDVERIRTHISSVNFGPVHDFLSLLFDSSLSNPLQDFICSSFLSSHMRCIAVKR